MNDGDVLTLEYRARNGWPAACEVQVWQRSDRVIVLVTDVGSGPSVTNFAEDIATELVARGIRFTDYVEHYPPPQEAFDRVVFEWTERDGRAVARHPRWSPLGRVAFLALVENH